MMLNDELKHFGILGMKWGVRRYENADGTLTPAGKKRYAKNLEYRDKLVEKAKRNSEDRKRSRKNALDKVKDLQENGANSKAYKDYVDEQVREHQRDAQYRRDRYRRDLDELDELDPYSSPESEYYKKRKEIRRREEDAFEDLAIEAATRVYYRNEKTTLETIDKLIKDYNNDASNYYNQAKKWAERSETLKNMKVTALNKKEIKTTYRGW